MHWARHAQLLSTSTCSSSVRHGTHHALRWGCNHGHLQHAVPTRCCDPRLMAAALPAVVPAVPLAESAETTVGSPPTTTIHWRQQTELQDVRCEERHKAVGAAEWQVRWH